ncbi:MAG: hypothetical protein EG824_01905 [Deltaproteobacteria bacterium]|nr:hypothetical protein [Deltaproteobacteria bacterium]
MNGKWIEVFRAGKQTDSAGGTREWTESDLDKIVANYNGQADHEAPVVVGHPEHNSPAFGWVESLKREGKILYAMFKDVLPEFTDAVGKKLYKKRSISLYPDLTLRHIGFLGGMPPAVKGLADIAFRDKGEAITVEFSDWRMSTLGRIIMKIRDYLVEKEGADKADGIISSWEVQDLLNEPAEQEPIKLYHEEESMKPEEVQAIVEKAVAGVTQQFTEALKGATDSVKTLQTEVAGLKTALETEQSAGRRREFSEFLNSPEMLKRIPEGQRDATINHLLTLVSAQAVEFGEGDQKQSISAVDAYKKQLRALPEVVEFSEVANKERGGQRQEKTITRTEFSAMPADKQMEFVTDGGTVTD